MPLAKGLIDRVPVEPIDFGAAYFGADYKVNPLITVHQPTIGEIIQYGEKSYWGLVNTVTVISSDMKSELADDGVYWGDVPDFELFKSIMHGMPVERTRILFGDVDFTKMGWYRQAENDSYCMYDPDSGVKIDILIYSHIFNYVATIHGIKKQPEYAGNMTTRRFMVEEDRLNKQRQRDKGYKSTLMPLASFLANSPGSTLGVNDMNDLHIFPFFDSVRRICTINSANLLLNGIYAGKVNPDKIQKKYLDGLRDLYDGKA